MHKEREGGRLKREGFPTFKENSKWVIEGGKWIDGNEKDSKLSDNDDKKEGRWSRGC